MSNAGKDFSNALNDPEVKKGAYYEVRALAENIRNTRAGLLKVSGNLVELDSKQDKSASSTQWGPQFKPHIRTFDEIIQFSLEQATDATVMIKSISSVLGDVTESDGPGLKVDLEQFIKHLNRKEGDVAQVKNQFGSFKDALGSFAAKLEAAFDSANQDQTLKVKMKEAKTRLNDLQKELHDLDEKIRTLGTQALTELGTGAAAAGVAILTMNPAAILAALGASIKSASTGVALKKAIDDRAKCEDNIKKQNAEIRRLLERMDAHTTYLKALAQANGSVRDVSASFAEASVKITVITDIWQTINSDTKGLNKDLTSSMGPGERLSQDYLRKLSTSVDIYRHVSLLLETYVEEVRAANI